MKKIIWLLTAVVLALTMAGCTKKDKKGEVDFSGDTVMPIVRIDTVSQEADAIFFATKPVSGHVSQQIASWTPNYQAPPEPYYEDCTITVEDIEANILLDSAMAQVKVRGNWTTSYEKKAFRIKFAEKQNLLGLNDGAAMKNWILLAEYKDASMLRDKTAFAIANEILSEDGLYASDAEFVEVYINDEYWGVYLLCEYQQINENRVDINEVEKDYKGTDIGYFLEFDGYFYTEDKLQQFFVDYADNAPLIPYDGKGGKGKTITCLKTPDRPNVKDVGFTIKSDIYCEEQRDFIASFVDGVYEIMYNAAYNDTAYEFNGDYTEIVKSESLTPKEAVEKVVDVKSLADMYIISELTCDADLYWSSFFMSVDFSADGNKKLTFEAPWDFDSGMGNKSRCEDAKGFYAANIIPDVNGNEYKTINPWLAVLAYEEWYQDIIRETWTKAYDDGVFERASEMIEKAADELSDAFDRNYQKWDNINHESFVSELSRPSQNCKDHKEAAEYLKNWLNSRVKFMNEHWHK
ncbi:MAG: spore coat protein CotH [Ruminococcus sp.]|nr:spore coat protein CotH [Ruminococcus sp.]